MLLVYAESFVDEEFLLVYGDLLFSAEAVKAYLTFTIQAKPDAAMAVVPVDKPESYGIIKLKKDNALNA